jgi:hypothetical protein
MTAHRKATLLAIAALTFAPGSPLLAPAIAAPALDMTAAPAGAASSQPAAADPPAAEQPRRRRPPPVIAPTPRLVVQNIASLPDAIAPDHALWDSATPMDVALQPQTTTSPMLDDPTVQVVQAVALTDGRKIAWRFSWPDANPASSTETGQFSDAVGVQFPLVPGAPYLMGAADMPVYSLYWKAQWQHDINHGFQDVLAKYPNAWSDVYWFGGDHPYHVPASFTDERAREWFIGASAGNPNSNLNRTTPVEEVIAEGFGTLTHVPAGIADGRGLWKDGRWHVVITRPIADDALSKLFAPGNTSEFAVAVWDGDAGNVGGRKHHSLWVQFEVGR